MDKQEIKSAKDNKIEELAYAIKFKQLNPVKLFQYKSKLASMLLEKINLAVFAQASSNSNTTMEENYYYNKYDGELFSMAFKSSLEQYAKQYGEIDKETGKKKLFIKYFSEHYGNKKKDLLSRKIDEKAVGGTKIKNTAIMIYLRKIAKLHGIPLSYVNSKIKNALNYNKVKQFLADIGASTEEIENLDKVFDNTLVSNDELSNDEDGNTYVQSDTTSKNRYDDTTNVLLDLTDKVEQAFKSSEDTTLKKYVRSFISFKILEYLAEGNHCIELADYVDKDFARIYLKIPIDERPQVKIDDIWASMYHKKTDTMRKKRVEVEKFLLKLYSFIE